MMRLRQLPRNARTCISVEPLWAFFGPTVTFFMPIYLRQIGLSEIQMGTINSINIATGLLFYIFAAPLTNKLGRRRTSLWFDFFAWSVPMIIWSVARNYLWFVIAAVSNSVVRIVIVSWNLLISEDADESQRPSIFGWINLIGMFGGFSTLVGGLFISRFGVLASMKWIFLLGALSMTSMFVIRYFKTDETQVGQYILQKSKDLRLLTMVGQQLPKAREALRDPFFLRMGGIYIIANAIISIDFFRALYLTEEKALSPVLVSSIPALSAVAGIVIFFFVLPRQTGSHGKDRLSGAFILCFGAQILFLLMPRASPWSAILIFPSLQAAYALLQTFRDTVFMNGTGKDQKSERFSLIQSLMMLFSIPMGWLAGFLYSLSPHLPFVFAAALYLAGFFLSRTLPKGEAAE